MCTSSVRVLGKSVRVLGKTEPLSGARRWGSRLTSPAPASGSAGLDPDPADPTLAEGSLQIPDVDSFKQRRYPDGHRKQGRLPLHPSKCFLCPLEDLHRLPGGGGGESQACSSIRSPERLRASPTFWTLEKSFRRQCPRREPEFHSKFTRRGQVNLRRDRVLGFLRPPANSLSRGLRRPAGHPRRPGIPPYTRSGRCDGRRGPETRQGESGGEKHENDPPVDSAQDH